MSLLSADCDRCARRKKRDERGRFVSTSHTCPLSRIWRAYIKETIEHSHRVMALYSKPGRFGGKPVSFDFR